VFETSVEDLLRGIQKFDERASYGRIFDRAHQVELERLEGAVQKELFAAASAAHALKDHSSSRVQASFNITGYAERLLECFGKDGVHDFVIGLRDIIHHLHMLKAGWHITDDFVSGERRVDLRNLFLEYRRRAREFHAWLTQTIETLPVESFGELHVRGPGGDLDEEQPGLRQLRIRNWSLKNESKIIVAASGARRHSRRAHFPAGCRRQGVSVPALKPPRSSCPPNIREAPEVS
jgi:hypothetical protein